MGQLGVVTATGEIMVEIGMIGIIGKGTEMVETMMRTCGIIRVSGAMVTGMGWEVVGEARVVTGISGTKVTISDPLV